MEKITVLGCGRWASFHAWYQIEKLNNEVIMWGRSGDPIYEKIAETGKNTYIEMPKSIKYTSDICEAIDFSSTIIVAISAQGMQDLSSVICKCKPSNKIFVLCMKGIDQNTGERLSEILRKNIDKTNKICVWVGPGHVQELTAGQPNVMIIAGDNIEATRSIIQKFDTPLLSIYESDDLIGVEVGAAAKNVMGIAAGFLDGTNLSSLKGALMARGCYEVSLLIDKLGGNKMTAFGMSHLGDFEATLFSKNSHNRRYGEEYIKGQLSDDIGTAEGVATTKAIYNLAKENGVFMPITYTVYSILYKNVEKRKALNDLLELSSRKEFRYE